MNELVIRTQPPTAELTVIRLSGVFEGMAAINGEAKLAEILKTVKTKNLRLDVSAIVYIDSAAIGALINVTKAAVEQKIQLSLFKPTENVKKVLSMTHVDRLIPIIEE